MSGSLLGIVDDFRTAIWVELVPYPELVYQKSQQFLQSYLEELNRTLGGGWTGEIWTYGQ